MTLLSRFLGQRSLTWQQFPGWEHYGRRSAADIAVNTEVAMRAANGKCIRLLADDIAQLPVDFYRKVGSESIPIPAASWYDYPTTRHWDTWPDHITEVVVSLLSDGNAFIQGLPQAYNPEYLYVLDPEATSVVEDSGRIIIKNGTAEYGDAQVAHLKWVRLPGRLRGLSVIQSSRDTTGLELAAREWASRFFANGATLSGVITVPGPRPPQEVVDGIRDSFNQKHQGSRRSHAVGMLTNGATYNPISIGPQDAALQPLWQQVLEEAAALYHIPPHMLGSQVSGGQSYASVEQKSIEYVQHAIVPIVRRLEVVYGRFIPGDDTFIKFNINALLRGDAQSRASVNAIYLQNKVITRDEVRAKEDWPPADQAKGIDTENGGFLQTPNNNAQNTPQAQAAPDGAAFADQPKQ